jgi:hypothetical protein
VPAFDVLEDRVRQLDPGVPAALVEDLDLELGLGGFCDDVVVWIADRAA